MQPGGCGSRRSELSGRVDTAPAPEPPRQIPSRARWPRQRHVVDARRAPGVAAKQPRQRHPAAASQPEASDGLVAIDRTGRQMPAVVTHQRRQGVPVNPDHGAPCVTRQALYRAGAVGTGRIFHRRCAHSGALICAVPAHGTKPNMHLSHTCQINPQFKGSAGNVNGRLCHARLRFL